MSDAVLRQLERSGSLTARHLTRVGLVSVFVWDGKDVLNGVGHQVSLYVQGYNSVGRSYGCDKFGLGLAPGEGEGGSGQGEWVNWIYCD